MDDRKTLYRIPSQGKIAGVCAGLADYFGLDVSLVRIAFVLGALASGGFVVLLYIVMAVVLPVEGEKAAADGGKTVGQHIQKLSEEMKDNNSAERLKNYAGVGLVIIGAWLVLAQLLPAWAVFRWSFVWPALLLLVGVWILVSSRSKK